MSDTLNFNMGSTTEDFTATDTDKTKWTPEDHAAAGDAREFGGIVGQLYEGKEADQLNAMLSTPIDDDGHALGDSRLFVQAVARAGRQFASILAKREGRSNEGPRMKFNMPGYTHEQRLALQREARSCLEKELMTARAEFIRRSGRPLPGWF